MPDKLSPYRSPGEKLISLFARLLFSGEDYSTTQLQKMLGCSKQTVRRLITEIDKAYGVSIEEQKRNNRIYYRIPHRHIPAGATISDTEMRSLIMCRSFAEHLLGKDQLIAATRALDKSSVLRQGHAGDTSKHFGVFRPGSIDYTPHQGMIRSLISAMEDRKVCRVSYQRIMADEAKVFFIKPLKIFSHRDTVYLHARRARTPGKPYTEPEFDPLLPIHRIAEVEITERSFAFPDDYDFDKVFNEQFGVIKGEPFLAEVEFSGWAARFVSERIWSPDQKIEYLEDGRIILQFTATSEEELITWVLSYGDEAKLISPAELAKAIKSRIEKMASRYVE